MSKDMLRDEDLELVSGGTNQESEEKKDSKGNPVRNWKQKVITWERKDEKPSKVTTAANYKAPAPINVSDLRKAVENI